MTQNSANLHDISFYHIKISEIPYLDMVIRRLMLPAKDFVGRITGIGESGSAIRFIQRKLHIVGQFFILLQTEQHHRTIAAFWL